MTGITFGIYTAALLLVLVVITPLFGIRDFRHLVRDVEAGKTNARTKLYTWTVIMEWALVFVFAGFWIGSGGGLAQLGLVPAFSGWQWLVVGLGVTVTVLAIWQTIMTLGSPEKIEDFRATAGKLAT